MEMFSFGAGAAIAVPTRDATGTAIAVPTPVTLAALQDIAVDLSVDLKTLHGAGKYPIAVGQGKGKTDIKAKTAKVSGAVLGSLFQGRTPSAGIKDAVINFAAAVPGTGPYTVTVAPPASGTFVADLGVRNAATGLVFTRVAASPGAGQYTVSAGVYTFAAGDASAAILLSYEYSATSAAARTYELTSDLMGYTPSFALLFRQSYMGKTLTMKLYNAVSGKMAIPFKNDDFTMQDFEATAFTNEADSLGWICLQ